MKARLLGALLAAAVVPAAEAARSAPKARPAVRPVVEVEEEVYRYTPANNGAGPMWCRGSTCLVRVGEHVLAAMCQVLHHSFDKLLICLAPYAGYTRHSSLLAF